MVGVVSSGVGMGGGCGQFWGRHGWWVWLVLG